MSIEPWGNCPVCLQSVVCLSVGMDHWGTCQNCLVRWYIGYNLFSLDLSVPEWDDPRRNGKNAQLLRAYQEVEPAMVLDDDVPPPERGSE